MPYCPKCRYEFRPEIEKCPDCGLKLVDKLPEEPEPEYVDLVQVASFPSPAEAHAARLLLEADGISAAVTDDVLSSINPVYTIADGGVKLLVPRPVADRARKILCGD